MHSETFDLLPGGGAQWSADLIGPNGRLTRLCKGAKEPDQPPPPTAPFRQDIAAEGEAARRASRKKGIQKTILTQDNDATAPVQTLGRTTQLGVVNPLLTPKNGGEM